MYQENKTNPINNGDKRETFPKIYRWPICTFKKVQYQLSLGECNFTALRLAHTQRHRQHSIGMFVSEKMNFHPLLVGMLPVSILLENNMDISQKTKNS